jgi:hypothetical protein
MHFFLRPELFFRLLLVRAARVACSNTSRTPSPFLAEHSMYLTAPMRFRTSSPWCDGVSSRHPLKKIAVRREAIVVFNSTHLLWGDGLLAGLVKLLDRLGIEAQILLAANENDGEAGAEVKNLGDPL